MNELAFKILKEEKEKLAGFVNDLINNDFEKLINILYRVDVDEKKLKQLLKENPGSDAGHIIAELIIERQIQKIKSRRDNKKENDISDEEKW